MFCRRHFRILKDRPGRITGIDGNVPVPFKRKIGQKKGNGFPMCIDGKVDGILNLLFLVKPENSTQRTCDSRSDTGSHGWIP